MSEQADDRHRAGFKERTRVAAARERLRRLVTPHDRTETVPVAAADGRVLAGDVTAGRAVPGYRRAAMDGYAVRAEDTFGASDRSPAVLDRIESGDDEAAGDGAAGHGAGDGGAAGGGDAPPAVPPRGAVRVHTGSEVPDGATAVVMIERVETVGTEIEVFDAVAEGENVGDPDEDVAADQPLYEAGHRLRPSDLGLLKSVAVRQVPVYEPPEVAVLPTGEELVQADPEPGEAVETNGLTVSRLVERWGGRARYREVVTDDEDALREAIRADLDADVVVTTGGSSVGERDLVPDVVAELGEVAVHGVALRPGHPVALGRIDGTPVVVLPGYPVACIINAVQFLRPAMKRAGNMPLQGPPTREAELGRKIRSEPGVRTYARVRLDDGERDGDGEREDGLPVAEPTRASGSGILSSVALADGWVVVPEESEGLEEGAIVEVEDWEWSA